VPKIAKCMGRLGTETAFEVLARAKELEAQGKSIIHLEIGEPDFATPQNIINAAKKALDEGWTHYGPSAGYLDFREVIANYIQRTRKVDTTADQVVVTPGAKPIIFFTILSLIEPGDEVVYPNPGFPIYESMINYIGAKAVPAPLLQENEFRMDVNDLKKLVNKKTRLIIVNSPQNPTGGVLTKEDLERIAELAQANDCWVLTDEVYSEILYDCDFHSIYSVPGMKERTILLEGASKTFAMTGWRLGYGIMPQVLQPHITRMMTNSCSMTSAFIQRAGMEAITGPWDDVRRMDAEFKRRRDVIVSGLNEIPGIKCLLPKGAFYVFPDITSTGFKAKELEQGLLNDGGVACLAGTSFGSYGEGHLRFSYANSVENINEALKRVRDYLAKNKK
jgi:aspartate aminotransferase